MSLAAISSIFMSMSAARTEQLMESCWKVPAFHGWG